MMARRGWMTAMVALALAGCAAQEEDPLALDGDGDGVPARTDCEDGDASISPFAPELCDGVDNDCDGLVDDADVLASGEGLTVFTDADGDGFGADGTGSLACDAADGVSEVAGDCDDLEPAAYPGASEVCDEVDNDCDGAVDEEATDATTLFRDLDGDGYGDARFPLATCAAEVDGYVANADDCGDFDPRIVPGATEICNGLDDDCDGALDDADDDVDPATQSAWYTDGDGDGFGAGAAVLACVAPVGSVASAGDCDDASAAIRPGAPEVCNDGVDDDCDGAADDASAVDATPYFLDADGDGFGFAALSVVACTQPANFVVDDTDCNDVRADINPSAPEVCNEGVDDDCDAFADDDDPSVDADTFSSWFADDDEDGYGDLDAETRSCEAPSGTVADSNDCDDDDEDVNPSATEVCNNGVDDDCDGGPNTCGLPALAYTDLDEDVSVVGSSTDYFGWNLGGGADVDGDGQQDLIGAATYDDNGGFSAGSATVFNSYESDGDTMDDAEIEQLFGTTSYRYCFDVVALGDVLGSSDAEIVVGCDSADGGSGSYNGLVQVANDRGVVQRAWYGASNSDYAGGALALVGDTDGDGTDELAVGAWGADLGGHFSNGAVYLVEATASSGSLASRATTIIRGESDYDNLGGSSSDDSLAAGDLDGDGTPDLVVGSDSRDDRTATTYFSSGMAAVFLGSLSTGTLDAESDADVLLLPVPDSSYLYFGGAVEVADLDDDGYGELVVSSRGEARGTVYVYEGSSSWTTSLDDEDADTVVSGSAASDDFGTHLDASGDVDGDGVPDLGIGDPYHDGLATSAGRVFVMLGYASGTFTADSIGMGTVRYAEVRSRRSYEYLGRSFTLASDVDGDGIDDLSIGAPYDNSSSGAVYTFLGAGI